MTSTITTDGFFPVLPVTFISKASGDVITLAPERIIDVVVHSNLYLFSMKTLFSDMGFDLYTALGQRNLSGFLGEIFVRSLEKSIPDYVCNPHGDGRPDLLDLTTEMAKDHYKSCFSLNEDGSKSPNRSTLAPFKYGGLEVKSSIGSPVDKKKREKDLGFSGFEVGVPRINYLQSITYWGHHASCENLLGLYYDYVPEVNGAPQILAVMHSELNPDSDWQEVSIGKEGSKKTSNTSLTSSGKAKLYKNVITVTTKENYLEKLKSIGLKIEKTSL